MVATSFRPSQVRAFFPNSSFKKGEKEIMAAHIVLFLSKEGNDDWATVIEVSAFFRHSTTVEVLHPVYEDPFRNPILAQGCTNAIWTLVEDGYLNWVIERRSFTVTEKLIGFYADYIQA